MNSTEVNISTVTPFVTTSAVSESSTGYTVTDNNATLQELNDAEFFRRLPPVIYLATLMVIGIPGNILVLIIYSRYFNKSVHRVFILSLAIADFAVCVTSLPFEIIEMRYQYTFYEIIACKFFRANNNFLNLCSIFLIFGMSVDRYRRVCHPLKQQITARTAKIVCCGALMLSLLISWPNFLISGTRHVKLENNITGYDCSMSDTYAKTKYPFIYNALLFLIFIVVITTLIVVYSCIGRKIYAHGRFRSRFTSSKNSISSQRTTSTSTSVHTGAANTTEEIALQKVKTSDGQTYTSVKQKSDGRSIKRTNTTQTQSERHTGKVTRIAFAISLVFILSYLPHLILTLMTAVKGGFVAKPGPVVSAVLPIVSRSIFINNVANPFVYGFIDPKFKAACKKMFSGEK